MHTVASFAAVAAALPSVMGAYQGFNYGATFTDNSVKTQSDFESEFTTAQGLAGTKGAFSSARLYTCIQGGSTDTPISAIPAAIKTNTTLLLGLWASAGSAQFSNEISALKNAISTYGTSFTELVVGISVGSEDLYRDSPTGIKANAGIGAGPDVIKGYITQVRNLVKGTGLSSAPIGHVDTWTAWVNGTNKEIIDSVDWLGVDAYPFFETENGNDISNGKKLLDEAMSNTEAVAGGKPLWVTETGWPVSGDKVGEAEANTKNAKTFWDEAGCPLFGNTNIWWYILQDAAPTTPNPSFGLVGSTLTTTPLYDLSCDNVTTTSTSSSSSAKATGSSTATKSGSSSGSKTTDSADASASGSSSSFGNSTAKGQASGTGSAGSASTGTSTSGSGSSGSGSGSGSSSSSSASSSSTAVISGSNMISGSILSVFVAGALTLLAL